MSWKASGAASILFLLLCRCAVGQSSPLFGQWQEPTGSVIEIGPCASGVCMWITAVSANAPATTDMHNPNPSLRSRPLCGLLIGSGFTLHGGDKADGGTLYDPKTGNTYHGAMTLKDDVLNLRGYVGFSLFGKTETWKRTAHPSGTCLPQAQKAPSARDKQ